MYKMDIVDESELERENYILDIAKKATSLPRNGGLIPTGICYNPNCEAEVTGQKLYCDGDCATEHSKISKRTGKY